MVRVYCYLTVVSLQYLTPVILTLNCTLLLKTLGERKWPRRERVGYRSLRQPWPQPPSLSFLPPLIILSLHPPIPLPSLYLSLPPLIPASTSLSLYSPLTGGYSWGLGPALPLSPVLAAARDGPVGPKEDEAQQAVARITGALGGLLTPLFLRGTLAFLVWWTAACQLLSSLFGLYFHQHLAGS